MRGRSIDRLASQTSNARATTPRHFRFHATPVARRPTWGREASTLETESKWKFCVTSTNHFAPRYTPVGSGKIWYHDNITVPGAGPDGEPVQIRTHSANPSAPSDSFSFGNYTTQINTSDGRYMLPDGSWKWLTEMTGDELSAAHMPAGN